MKRWRLALISIVLVSSAASAQTAPRLAHLEVALWPEYDRRAVLVMLRGSLAADVALPVTVQLPIPARAGRPHAVAKRAPGGALLLAEHTVDVKGDWARVNVMTDMRGVRLEYYVDLKSTDPERRFVFEWPGGVDIDKVTYEVMWPVGATDFSVEPPPSSQGTGNDGLTYFLGDLGAKGRNETFSIGITYTKTTSTLTAGSLRPLVPPAGQMPPAAGMPSGTPATPPATPSGSGGADMWLLALVIVLAAALAGTWIFMARKKSG